MLNDLDEMAKSSQLNLLLNGGDSAKSAQVHAISLAVFTSFPRKTMTHEVDFTYWEQSNQGLSQRQLSVCFGMERKPLLVTQIKVNSGHAIPSKCSLNYFF